MTQVRDEDGGESWFASRHDPSKGPSGTILRLLYVRTHPYSFVFWRHSQLSLIGLVLRVESIGVGAHQRSRPSRSYRRSY